MKFSDLSQDAKQPHNSKSANAERSLLVVVCLWKDKCATEVISRTVSHAAKKGKIQAVRPCALPSQIRQDVNQYSLSKQDN